MSDYKAIRITKLVNGSSKFIMAWDGKRLLGFILPKGSTPATKRRKK